VILLKPEVRKDERRIVRGNGSILIEGRAGVLVEGREMRRFRSGQVVICVYWPK
jgi:archaeosine-15-forming tRNA-guanine transglycosylase